MVDEDLAHDARSEGQEVVSFAHGGIPLEAHPGLVQERRRLERLRRPLMPELSLG